ncbi:probable carboxylesterase 18 [Zingiber officinale]|uniref:Alpha/beta hydrolase fold-3 domain-containing protein n=1 Tax=Zingiber officinale TaxID=94328 RepID=A0A8J5GYR4_ZINOF|nr:probable carboxylesterase 18 [Zingiber officinale]KAG6512826.1 hypothetical protein ZIOFF_030960 [Zingiber officinale]
MTETDTSPAKPWPSAASLKLPWKTRISVAAISTVTDFCRRSNGSLNRSLLSLIDARSPASATPVRGVRTADVTVDPSRNLWFRLFVPSSGESLPVIVFFHGGGFVFLSPDSRIYDAVCRRICRKIPALVLSVNYRLSPEHRYPAPYEDGADVLRFLDGNGLATADAAAAGLADLSSCFLAGDSAGANIAHHMGRRWAADAWERIRLAGMVLIQPFFGGEERTEAELRLTKAPMVSVERTDWMWRAFLPEGADRDHEAANPFGPRAEGELEAALPEAMVVVGGFDPLQDWQRRYYEGLRARGRAARLVEYPEAMHAFYAFPEIKESDIVLEEIKGFIDDLRVRSITTEQKDGDAGDGNQ